MTEIGEKLKLSPLLLDLHRNIAGFSLTHCQQMKSRWQKRQRIHTRESTPKAAAPVCTPETYIVMNNVTGKNTPTAQEPAKPLPGYSDHPR